MAGLEVHGGGGEEDSVARLCEEEGQMSSAAIDHGWHGQGKEEPRTSRVDEVRMGRKTRWRNWAVRKGRQVGEWDVQGVEFRMGSAEKEDHEWTRINTN